MGDPALAYGQDAGRDVERLQGELVELVLEDEADDEAHEERGDADDQPLAQLDEVVEQRRAGRFDFGFVGFVAHDAVPTDLPRRCGAAAASAALRRVGFAGGFAAWLFVGARLGAAFAGAAFAAAVLAGAFLAGRFGADVFFAGATLFAAVRARFGLAACIT